MIRRSSIFVVAVLLTRTGLAQPEPEFGEEQTEEPLPGEGSPEANPSSGVSRSEAEDQEPPDPPLIPPALDTLGGHFTASAALGWVIPFGNLEDGVAQRDFMGSGPGLGLDLGYGVSRTVLLGVFGQAFFLDEGSRCKGCSTTSYAGGAFIRYHLVQGVRFDPWMSAGIGYRATSIEATEGSVDYSGIEWLRLQLGGDWYAFDKLGFGPLFELNLGRYSTRKPGDLSSGANHWHFSTGFRVTFDTPGK